MVEALFPQISQTVDRVVSRIYKLLIVVLPVDLNQTIDTTKLSELPEFSRINVGLELSRGLLEIAKPDRVKQAPNLLRALVEEGDPKGVILERLELLFEKSLELNPLDRLKRLSKDRTLVAIWYGKLQNGHLLYAEFGHPEYRSYRPDEISDIIVIS